MMPAYDLIPILSKLTRFPESTTETFYRRLNEAGLIPRSAGRSRTLLSVTHVVIWLLAMIADVPSRSAAEAASSYFDLRNHNGTTAGAMLVLWLESMMSAQEIYASGEKLDEADPRAFAVILAIHAATSRLEIDCGGGAPRIRIVADLDGKGDVAEVIYGSQKRPWQDGSIRKTYVVPGRVLLELSEALNKSEETLCKS
jgi:hypothetical protein